jgi:hypothetical protein
MRPGRVQFDTGESVPCSRQCAENRAPERRATPAHSCSDFEMTVDDDVHPDLDVFAALGRLDEIDAGRSETNPLRRRIDAIFGGES